jgi:hypothetical protein
MAIAQRGSGTSGGASGSNNDTVTMTKPTGLTIGDLLVAVITTNDQTVTAPSGWTQLFNIQGTASATWRTRLYYKIATSTETAASNFTFTVPNSDSPVNGTLTAWSGVDTTTPIGTNYATDVDGSLSEPTTGPTATNGATNGRVLYVRSVRQASASDNSLTLTEATGSASLIVSRAAFSGGSTVYANAQFADDADFGAGGNKTGLAVTCNKTESDNVQATIVMKMAGVPATGDWASTLPSMTSVFAATREIPAGTITSSLPSAVADFAGAAAPPEGPLATTLPSVTSTFAGESIGGGIEATLPSMTSDFAGGIIHGAINSTLPSISSDWAAAVNPIGGFTATLPFLTDVLFTMETRPFGEHVIQVEDEKRAFRITADDMVPIYRSQVTDQ